MFDECDEELGELGAADGAFDENTEDIFANGIDISFLSEGGHTLLVRAEDVHENEGGCAGISFCVDKTPPATEKAYGEPFFEELEEEMETEHYITSDTEIALYAADAETCSDSDVTATWYSVTPEGEEPAEFQEYDSPFMIEAEGAYEICFYSVDNYCNSENIECQTVNVDNTPPETTKSIDLTCNCTEIQCPDFDTDYLVSSNSSITLGAEDPGEPDSDVKATYYRYCLVDETIELSENATEGCEETCPGGEWIEYGGPFSLVGDDGYYHVEYYSVDNVGNEEERKCEEDLLSSLPLQPSSIGGDDKVYAADFNVSIYDETVCMSQALCEYRVYNSVCGEWTEWMARACNSTVEIEIGECCIGPQCCGAIKDLVVEAKITDCLGRTNSASGVFKVDLINPPATVIGPSGTVDGPLVNLTIDTNKLAECRFDVVDKSFDDMAFMFNTSDGYHHWYELDLEDGHYSYRYRCKDVIDNTMPWGLIIEFDVDSTENIGTTTTVQASSQSSGSGSGASYYSSSSPKATTTTAKATTTTASSYGADSAATTTTIEQADNIVYEEPSYESPYIEEPLATIQEDRGQDWVTGMMVTVGANPVVIPALLALLGGSIVVLLKRPWASANKKKE
jgi:hypothetical protein